MTSFWIYKSSEKRIQKALKQLLDHGLNPNHFFYSTILYRTLFSYIVEICDYPNLLQLLISAGMNVDYSGDMFPLHTVSKWGRTRLANVLIANISYQEPVKGYTPLHYAVNNRYVELVVLLLDKGVDIQVKTKNGDSPLHSV